MPDMGYDATGLRAGASAQLSTANTIEQLVTALAHIEINSVMFGRVGAAARLATALDLARRAQGRAAATESAARTDLGARVHATAGQGDALTATTASIAAAGRGAIVEGMSRRASRRPT